MDRESLRDQRVVLCEMLRTLRHQAGLRQQEVAIRLGEHQSFVSKYESGERRLDVLELRQICLALDIQLITVIQLLEDQMRGKSA